MKQGEETEVVGLVLSVFSEFVAPHFSDDGIGEFSRFVNEESITERFQSGNPIILAQVENQTVGVVEVRDNSHIALLFVKKSYQKMGIATKLLREAIKVCKDKNPSIKKITVYSSPNAYAAYKRFGFKGEKNIITANGMKYIPLEFELDFDTCSQP
jgi:GNAT superfamily N-acetyltransferase